MPTQQHPHQVSHLPPELWLRILAYLPHPTPISKASTHFSHLSQCNSYKALWIRTTYGVKMGPYMCFKHRRGWFFPPPPSSVGMGSEVGGYELAEMLVGAGGCVPRFMLQEMWRCWGAVWMADGGDSTDKPTPTPRLMLFLIRTYLQQLHQRALIHHDPNPDTYAQLFTDFTHIFQNESLTPLEKLIESYRLIPNLMENDTSTFEKLVNHLNPPTLSPTLQAQSTPSTSNWQEIKNLICLHAFTPLPVLSPSAMFRVFQLSRMEMGILDVLIYENGMDVRPLSSGLMEWVLTEHLGKVVDMDDDAEEMGGVRIFKTSDSHPSLPVLVVGAEESNLFWTSRSGHVRNLKSEQTVRAYLQRGFKITPQVLNTLLKDILSAPSSASSSFIEEPTTRDPKQTILDSLCPFITSTSNLQTPSPTVKSKLAHLSTFLPPASLKRNDLRTAALSILQSLLSPTGHPSPALLSNLMHSSLLTPTDLHSALLIPVERRGGVGYATRVYDQEKPWIVWCWVLNEFGSDAELTKHSWRDLCSWVCEQTLRFSNMNQRGHQQQQQQVGVVGGGGGGGAEVPMPFWNLVLAFLGRGCVVEAKDLGRLVKCLGGVWESAPVGALMVGMVGVQEGVKRGYGFGGGTVVGDAEEEGINEENGLVVENVARAAEKGEEVNMTVQTEGANRKSPQRKKSSLWTLLKKHHFSSSSSALHVSNPTTQKSARRQSLIAELKKLLNDKSLLEALYAADIKWENHVQGLQYSDNEGSIGGGSRTSFQKGRRSMSSNGRSRSVSPLRLGGGNTTLGLGVSSTSGGGGGGGGGFGQQLNVPSNTADIPPPSLLYASSSSQQPPLMTSGTATHLSPVFPNSETPTPPSQRRLSRSSFAQSRVSPNGTDWTYLHLLPSSEGGGIEVLSVEMKRPSKVLEVMEGVLRGLKDLEKGEGAEVNANDVDVTQVVKIAEKPFTKFAVEHCQELFRETEKRDPSFFKLKHEPSATFAGFGQLEVIENELKTLSHFYTVALKKKSPQKAWNPVFARLEALTLYIQSKQDWFDIQDKCTPSNNTNEYERADDVFMAYGAGWVCLLSKLNEFGAYSESNYPSLRSTLNLVFKLGASLNAKRPELICDWPQKLESLWLGIPYPSSTPSSVLEDDQQQPVSQKKLPKKSSYDLKREEHAQLALLKKQKRKMKNHVAESEDPWDFKEALRRLRGDRTHIGGEQFLIRENEIEA
ncbi:hypothetical protein HDV05_004256 [Chytridiales sp. JEL 0842]|nr:hypothetical protein HDV05_004256 [Chytridiales sp. JEL 0842]